MRLEKKEKKNGDIWLFFFFLFFFLTIRKYFVSKPKLKTFWSSLFFVFCVFFVVVVGDGGLSLIEIMDIKEKDTLISSLIVL